MGKLSQEVVRKTIFWRLVLGKYASLQELKESWTLVEVLDFNELLDAQEVAVKLKQESMKK